MHNDRRIAFDLFYAEHATPAYRFALRLCGNPDDAEDLTANAFVKAYGRWSQFRGDSAHRSWLFAIVLNEWKMHCRKRGPVLESLDLATSMAGTMQDVDVELAGAIAALPDKLRIAFLLVKGEGLTHAEAAKVVRVPVGTMYFRVHSAVAKLRIALTSEPETHREVICNHEM